LFGGVDNTQILFPIDIPLRIATRPVT